MMMSALATKLCLHNALSLRCFSSTASLHRLINLSVNDKTGIATMELNNPPINGINLELAQDISSTLTDLSKNPPRGLILSSTLPNILSAGVDVTELYKPKLERFKVYWTTLQDNFIKFYGTPYPTAAAVNGHSGAGATLLSLACEYRVMLPNLRIGLNETTVGIIPPDWAQAMYLNAIPRHEAEKALTLGYMFSTDEALKIGLVDEVATDKQDAINRCEKFLLRHAKINPAARALTKKIFRGDAIDRLEKNREQDFQQFWDLLITKPVQKNIEMFIESLKAKKSV